jgi:hypothetical protein
MFVVGKNIILKHNLDVLYVVRAVTKIEMKFKQNAPCVYGEMFRFCPDSFVDTVSSTQETSKPHISRAVPKVLSSSIRA